MSQLEVERILRVPGVNVIERWSGVGATQVQLLTSLYGGLAGRAWIVIAPYSSNCEIRKITAIKDRHVTLSSALTYAIPDNTPVMITTDPVALVDWFGVIGDGETDNTTAFTQAADQAQNLGSGGVLLFSGGTFIGNFNLSRRGGSGYFVLRGQGQVSTTLRASSGIVLDLCATSFTLVESLRIYADTGASVGVLMGRYSEYSADAGGDITLRNVTVHSLATVAGIYNVGAELSSLDRVKVYGFTAAPCVYVTRSNKYGAANTVYASPNGTLTTTSMVDFYVKHSSFIKDDVTTPGITGPVFEVGPGVVRPVIEDCYMHGVADDCTISLDTHGESTNITGLNLRRILFESGGVTSGHGNTPIRVNRSGAAGSMELNHMRIEDNQFNELRGVSGYYDIDLTATGTIAENARIQGNASVGGGGLKAARIRSGYVQWYCPYILLGAGITATDTTFTAADGHTIQVDDYILVGQSQQTDADASFTQSERKQVTNVVGNTISVDTAFAYNHPNGDVVYIGLPQVAYSDGVHYVTQGYPQFTGDYGNIVDLQGGYQHNLRTYYGPNGTVKNAPVLVNRPFYDEPGNPETGMLACYGTTSSWATSASLDGWARAYMPVWYNYDRWFAIPMALRGSATWNPGDLADGDSATTTIAVTGSEMGDYVIPSFSLDLSGLVLTGYVSAGGTVTVVLGNLTGGNVNLAEGTISVIVMKH